MQGLGEDAPILQWVPLLKRIQAAGKSFIVDLQLSELEAFMEQVRPEGVFLCMNVAPEQQPAVLKRIERWK